MTLSDRVSETARARRKFEEIRRRGVRLAIGVPSSNWRGECSFEIRGDFEQLLRPR